MIDKTSSEPFYIQIYHKIKADIEAGTITGGERLPSKRELSSNLGVSVITVENAYAQLMDEGYIRSEAKKGYFVENIAIAVGKEIARPVEVENNIEGNSNDTSLFPFSVWAKLMREELCYHQSDLMTRPPSEGVSRLRTAIAAHLKSFRNMNVSPEQIIIGAGTEYLYMLLHLLLDASAVIGVEEPGYSKIAEIYQSFGHKIAWIPMETDGISMDGLNTSKADVLHISPSHQFPTGAITSISKRYALLGWAAQGRYIIEDDYDSEFRLSGKPIPSLFSIDVTDRVIYMNTFSKSLASTIRISYMILPVSLLEQYRKQLNCYSCAVSTFEQYTLAEFISGGYFEKHIHRMRTYSKKRRDLLLSLAKKDAAFADVEFSGINAGMHCLMTVHAKESSAYVLSKLADLNFRTVSIEKFYENMDTIRDATFVVYYCSAN